MCHGIVTILGLAVTVASSAAGQATHGERTAAARKIASALSAAPTEIGAKATVGEMGADGKMTTLRHVAEHAVRASHGPGAEATLSGGVVASGRDRCCIGSNGMARLRVSDTSPGSR